MVLLAQGCGSSGNRSSLRLNFQGLTGDAASIGLRFLREPLFIEARQTGSASSWTLSLRFLREPLFIEASACPIPRRPLGAVAVPPGTALH